MGLVMINRYDDEGCSLLRTEIEGLIKNKLPEDIFTESWIDYNGSGDPIAKFNFYRKGSSKIFTDAIELKWTDNKEKFSEHLSKISLSIVEFYYGK